MGVSSRGCRREGSPRAARYFPSLSQPGRYGLKDSWFMEDVHLGAMPIGGRSARPDFNVKIKGDGKHTQRAVAILNTLSSYGNPHQEKELLSYAINEIARRLSEKGTAVFELVKDEENDGSILLYSFTSERLFHAFGKYIQVIPKADREILAKAYVVIPERDIWKISMPDILGGRRGYRAVLKELCRFSNLLPSFRAEDLSKYNSATDFDFEFYRRKTEVLCAKTTKLWGWNQRDYSLQNCTEFYQFHKSLRFKWAQAILREHILSELNSFLKRIGVNVKITVKGLPTPSEISAVQEEMLKGCISFGDADKKCSVY